MSVREEAIIIDDDDDSDKSSGSSSSSSAATSVPQEVISIASSSSKSNASIASRSTSSDSDDGSSSISVCSSEPKVHKHQHLTRAASQKRKLEAGTTFSSPRKRTVPREVAGVIEIQSSSSSQDDDTSSDPSLEELATNKARNVAKGGNRPAVASRPVALQGGNVARTLELSPSRREGRKRRRAAPKRFDSDEESSNFKRCPICFALIPKYNIESHAATCGLNDVPAEEHILSPAQTILFRSEESVADSSDAENETRADMDRKQPAIQPLLQRGDPVNAKNSKREASPKEKKKPEAKCPHDEAHQALTRGGAKRRFNSDINPATGMNTSWRQAVEEALRAVRDERLNARSEILRKSLKEKNEMRRRQQQMLETSRLKCEYPLLNEVDNKTLEVPKQETKIPLAPRDTFHTVFLKRHFQPPNEDKDSSDDGDDKSVDEGQGGEAEEFPSPSQLLTGSPERDYIASKIRDFYLPDNIGAGFEDKDTSEEIDRVLETVQPLNYDQDRVNEYLALLLQENVKRVQDRYEKLVEKARDRKSQRPKYDEMMSSFRDLFCRRCFTYDCNYHGLSDNFCPKLQAELALQKELRGEWEEEQAIICQPVAVQKSLSNVEGEADTTSRVATSPVADTQLSELQKVLSQRLYHIFRDDVDKVSSVLGASRQSIMEQVSLESMQFNYVDPDSLVDPRSKQRSNTYNPVWLKRIIETESHPFFFPCHHTGPCSEESCTCIKNGFFCTKHCIWSSTSRNFFRGCNCAGRCINKSCPCFASNRECDPDLCKRCGACTDPPNRLATTQRCRNDNIGMRRHVHLLLAKSDVAGWGLFTKYDLQKGDYVHEYLGEVVAHNEAERRGAIYDQRNQTYLFDLSTDFAVDALRKGNKTRFINHSNTPNLAPRLCVANGDFRIGFYAKTDIPAQAELFFDYGKMFFSKKGTFIEKSATKNVANDSTDTEEKQSSDECKGDE